MVAWRKISLAIALIVLSAAMLLTAAIAWRLGQGPIDLSFLNSRIEEQLSAIAPGITARVERTEIAWLHHLPEIRVVGVEARRGGTVLLSLPQLGIRPSLRALVRATFAVERVSVSGVQLRLWRELDGSVLLGTAERPTQTPIDPSVLVPAPSGGSAARYFKRIRVRDSTLHLEDLGSATRWSFEGVRLDVTREVGGFEGALEALVKLDSPKASAIHGLELPVSVDARLQLDPEGSYGDVTFQARSQDGRLEPAGEPGPALPIRSLFVDGRFTREAGRMTLDKVQLAVGGAEANAAASLSISDASHGLELNGNFTALSVTELKRLWPRGMVAGARKWIAANIHDGRVPSGRFVIRLPPAKVSAHPAATDTVDVKFEFAGLDIAYYGDLDPVVGARGSGALSAEKFEGRVSQGQVGGLQLQNGRVTIDWGAPVTTLDVQADVSGPSAAALALVDRPPLHIAQKIGIAPQDLGGSGESHVTVDLPLEDEVDSQEVHVAVDSTLSDASVPKLFGDVGFNAGTLALEVKGDKVNVEGDAVFTGLPIPPEPAHARVSYQPAENDSESRLLIDVAGSDFATKATAFFVGGALAKLEIPELRLAGSDVGGVITTDGGRYHVSLQGKRVDLEPLESEHELGTTEVAYDADFKIQQIHTRMGIDVANATGTISGVGRAIHSLSASGDVEGGSPVSVEVGTRNGRQRLRARSDNPGPLLKALGLAEEAVSQGGRVALVIDLPDGKLGETFDGRVYARDFKITRAPMLARILSVASLNGIANMLNGEGLEFKRARIPFHWSKTAIELHDALAVGAIGLTARGTIDRGSRELDLHGRVIPSYTLNSALGKIPLIGEYLVGGKDEGVFGIDFTAKGSLGKPEVRVNPLSALAPGALRKMFIDPFKSDDSDASDEGIPDDVGGESGL